MAYATLAAAVETTNVGMGQIAVVRKPHRVTSVLGSCVGVALVHSRLGLGALAHVVLPESAGRPGNPGKFADTAVPHLLRELQKLGATPAGVVAKIAGGACMFGVAGPLQIGDLNIQAVLRALAAAGIRVVGKHVGGKAGRRVTLDSANGSLIVESAGCPSETL
jgi:chemotaxis protein CheD